MKTPTPKVGTHFGVRGFIPLRSPKGVENLLVRRIQV